MELTPSLNCDSASILSTGESPLFQILDKDSATVAVAALFLRSNQIEPKSHRPPDKTRGRWRMDIDSPARCQRVCVGHYLHIEERAED